MRRYSMATAATAAALAGLVTVKLWAADQSQTGPHHHVTAEMDKCMKECARCARECESCFKHCVSLVAEGKKEHLRTLRTCNDCGDMCAMAGKLVARDGAFMNAMCEACANACDGCGAECAKYPHDEHMSRCAQACKDCAKACRDMVKAE
jgi:hypothetical protein